LGIRCFGSLVHTIRLDNAVFEGENAVYLLDPPAGPTTLIDVGVATDPVREDLQSGFDDAGVAIEDLDRILLTHWHSDHAGLAGEIQAESDAAVYVHEADAPLVARDADALADLRARQEAALDDWGMPADEQRELLAFLDDHQHLGGEPVDVTPLTAGDTVPVGDFDVEVVHLPGHAAGLVAYAFERDGRREAFVGDAVLPKYTPNVGGADVRVDRPLQQYLDSLERVQALELDRAWPGHRGAIFAPSERARDIAVHHDERTERVLDAVAGLAPATAWEVSAELFGSLSEIHVLHGPGEAFAHLDHLVREGDLERTEDGYVPA
jgi:glyoxylase-like metal-dependent hydrolase (beta-lactamase superfamily II)